MSAVLDNLTTSIVMIMLIRKLVPNYKESGCLVVYIIAANSGGSPGHPSEILQHYVMGERKYLNAVTIPHLFHTLFGFLKSRCGLQPVFWWRTSGRGNSSGWLGPIT